MTEGNSYANEWEEAAATSGLKVFPVRIVWNRIKGRWDKRPLIDGWQDAANYHALTDFDWSRANGYGMLMGRGYYALDLDDWKEGCAAQDWCDFHQLPPTRVHTTVSGGRHLIFMVRSFGDLPTRTGIVPGLDGRGRGGFIAFGEGYSVQEDRAPSILPEAAAEAVAAGSGAGVDAAGEKEFLSAYRPVKPEGVEEALNIALITGPNILRERWMGGTRGLRDTSRSALDHSVARLLGMMGMSEEQIVWALLSRYEHGAARSKDADQTAIRAAARSALKSVLQKRNDDSVLKDFREPEMTGEEEAELSRMIFGR